MEIANTNKYINKLDVKIGILVCACKRVRINSFSTLCKENSRDSEKFIMGYS